MKENRKQRLGSGAAVKKQQRRKLRKLLLDPRSRHTKYSVGFQLLKGYDIATQMIYSTHDSSCIVHANYLPSNPKESGVFSNLISQTVHEEHR